MDPFRVCVALAPLACYFLVIGGVNLRRRPTLVSGGRDTMALCAAIVGLVFIGPMDLFMPVVAIAQFGAATWLLWLLLYSLWVSLYVLVTRPRMVVYNVTKPQLQEVMDEVACQLDTQSRWAGSSLAMPGLGIQARLDSFPPLRNASVVANSYPPQLAHWQRLEDALTARLSEVKTDPNPRGVSLVLVGLAMVAICMLNSLGDQQALAQGMRDMLRM